MSRTTSASGGGEFERQGGTLRRSRRAVPTPPPRATESSSAGHGLSARRGPGPSARHTPPDGPASGCAGDQAQAGARRARRRTPNPSATVASAPPASSGSATTRATRRARKVRGERQRYGRVQQQGVRLRVVEVLWFAIELGRRLLAAAEGPAVSGTMSPSRLHSGMPDPAQHQYTPSSTSCGIAACPSITRSPSSTPSGAGVAERALQPDASSTRSA